MMMRSVVFTGLSLLIAAPAYAAVKDNNYYLMSFFDPVPGKDAPFDKWWSAYLKSIATVPGIKMVEDFRRGDQIRGGQETLPSHLGLFTVDGARLNAVYDALRRRLRDGEIKTAASVDQSATRTFTYHHQGVWAFKPPTARSHIFLQMVFANPTPGEEAEFDRWYVESHVPQLSQVPGVIQIERSKLAVAAPLLSNGPTPPLFLSDMRIEIGSIEQFKKGLEKVAPGFTDTKSYDVAHAWRQTYERAAIVTIK